MSPRRAIGVNPLDAIVPSASASPTTDSAASHTTKRARRKQGEKERVEKVRATFHMSKELVEAVRNAVYHLSGPPERLTMAALAESAFRRELARLERKHNDGAAFPERGEDLRGGRPIGM